MEPQAKVAPYFHVPPHGGELVSLLVKGKERDSALERSRNLIRVPLNSLERSDLVMLGIGAFSPLKGFMGEDDYKHVVREMRLHNGVLWPIPITLSVGPFLATDISEGMDIALYDPDRDEIAGLMRVEEKYQVERINEAKSVFGTPDPDHPGVAKIFSKGNICLGGPVQVLSEGSYPEDYPEYARPPETRKIFLEKGWKRVVALQTRNPMHRSHEYLARIALEVSDGLFIHPIVGNLKKGDIPADVRMKCYRVLIDKYLPKDRVVLKVYPMEMRYGGPREAILHAIIRQNFGCTDLIIGRDHAGVGNYYGPFDAQEIFDQLGPDDLFIRPLKIDWTFWCSKCQCMASLKTCPHRDNDHLLISGTQLRKMLSRGEEPPPQFSRPEVIKILRDYYGELNSEGGKKL